MTIHIIDMIKIASKYGFKYEQVINVSIEQQKFQEVKMNYISTCLYLLNVWPHFV